METRSIRQQGGNSTRHIALRTFHVTYEPHCLLHALHDHSRHEQDSKPFVPDYAIWYLRHPLGETRVVSGLGTDTVLNVYG